MHGSQKNFDFFYQHGKGEQMIIKAITASNEMWNKVKIMQIVVRGKQENH